MRMKQQFIGGLVAVALASGAATGIVTAPAHASTPKPKPTSASASQEQDHDAYSARDVVSFFILGTGPLMESHRALAKAMHIQKHSIKPDIVTDVVSFFEKADPNLQARVVDPLQSGDPVRAQAALEVLTEDLDLVTRLMRSDGGASAARADGSARGAVYTINYAVTVQLGAIVVVALGGAVVLAVAVVLYRPDGGTTRFDREMAARNVALEL